jgi:hypothetical protein
MENTIFRMRASQSGLLLTKGKDTLGLGASLITYLKDYYAEQKSGVKEEIHSKYLIKGNMMEDDLIDITAERLGLGILEKNEVRFHDEHFQGVPDVITDEFVIDTKNSWNYKTFLDAITSPINTDYVAQLQVYMHLTGLKKAKLVYGLLDTPAEANYGEDVFYSHIPIEQRFYVFDLDYDPAMIESMQNKVNNCKIFLDEYDQRIKSLLG